MTTTKRVRWISCRRCWHGFAAFGVGCTYRSGCAVVLMLGPWLLIIGPHFYGSGEADPG